MIFPPFPEPFTVEIEVTNHCNAKCSFCPHSTMSRVRQYIDVEKYETFIKNLVSVKKNLWMNRVSGLDLFPRIVFAGLGEPTLHPQLTELVRIAAREVNTFPTISLSDTF